MAFTVDKNGNINLVQGDSGTLVVKGIFTDKNYAVYFAVRDKNRNPIGQEIYVNSNNQDTVTFELTGEFTDLLKVNKNEEFTTYYYGLKICSQEKNTEDTLIIGSESDIGDVNTITVYPKKVEGI